MNTIFRQCILVNNFVIAWLLLVFMSVSGMLHADANNTSFDVKGLDVNGYNLEYVDIGAGEPIVFVHGAIGDYRTWANYLQPISESARYVAYTRRHYGTQDWPEDAPTQDDQVQHAKDLAALIESLDAGPVHLVSWSNSGKTVAILGATRQELIKSITQFEPVLSSRIMEGIEEAVEPGKSFSAGWAPVAAALENDDHHEAARKMVEHVFEMQPGGFASIPSENQQIFLDNARTIPLVFNDITNDMYTCDYIGNVKAPTIVVAGENTNKWWQLMAKQVAQCHDNGQLVSMPGVNHIGPAADVEAFIEIVMNNVNKNQ